MIRFEVVKLQEGVIVLMSFMVFVYFITGIFYVYIGMATHHYHTSGRPNRLFLVICLDLAVWAMLLAMMNAVKDAETATFFRRYATLCWSFLYSLLLHFALVLTTKDRNTKKLLLRLIIYIPAFFSIYLYFIAFPVTSADIVKIPFSWAYLNPTGRGFLWDHFFTIYYITYLLLTLLVLYRWGSQSKIMREKHQAKIIIVTMLAVTALGSVTDVILPNMRTPYLPPLSVFFILISVLGIWYSIQKHRLMNLLPENICVSVTKTMREGMIVTDDHLIIQDVNLGALEMLDHADAEDVLGKPVNIFFQNEIDLKSLGINCTHEQILRNKQFVTIPVLLSSSILKDQWGDIFGTVLMFQNLSEIKKIQNKLQDAYDLMERKVQERTRELAEKNIDLKNEIAERVKMSEEIERLAYYDILTDLPNRKLFSDYLAKTIKDSQRSARPFAVMFLDLDSFKQVNDMMGHIAGDELLKLVSQRMSDTVRTSDLIGRAGGDEFLLLLRNVPDSQTAEMIATKLIKSFDTAFYIDKQKVFITASIGIAIFPIDGQSAEILMKNAINAMFKAKETGKNKFEICTITMKNRLTDIMRLSNFLHRAIERDEFLIHYQPQVDSISGSVVGIEALLRWNNPILGSIPPSEFIPIAEKNGMIFSIGNWVIKTACQQNKAWQDQGISIVPVAVNISVKQLLNTHFVLEVSKILKETELDPRFLEFEITESVLMQETDYILASLNRLNELGIKITIDDFGMEYSSLRYLKLLPIKRIKIDKNFIDGIGRSQMDEAIVTSIVLLAENLKLEILAEGVENKLQLDFLKSVKCPLIQGFYFSKPLSQEQIRSWLVKPRQQIKIAAQLSQ